MRLLGISGRGSRRGFGEGDCNWDWGVRRAFCGFGDGMRGDRMEVKFVLLRWEERHLGTKLLERK